METMIELLVDVANIYEDWNMDRRVDPEDYNYLVVEFPDGWERPAFSCKRR